MDTDRRRTSSYLVVRQGNGPEQVVLWDTVEITVGRLDSQDIVVPDPEVSRRHTAFRRRDDRFAVEDLDTSLGTLVNGEPIKLHELQHGDVVEIGMLKLKFGQTTRSIKPGANIRFASELKGFGVPAARGDAAGRTMLGFDVEDDLLSSAPTLIPQAPPGRAVTADGVLEELDAPDPLAPGDEGLDAGTLPAVRDLDQELAGAFGDSLGPLRDDGWAASAPTASSLTPPPRPDASASEAAVRLVLEVQGPAAQVEALLASVRDKRIEVPPLTLCVRDPRPR